MHRAGAAQDIHPLAPFLSVGGGKQWILVSDVQESAEDRRLPPPPHPPGLSLLQGGALGLHGVVDDAAGPPGEIHGDQGVLGHASLWRETRGTGGGRGGRGGSEVKRARHTHWGVTNPVCSQNHCSLKNASLAFRFRRKSPNKLYLSQKKTV